MISEILLLALAAINFAVWQKNANAGATLFILGLLIDLAINRYLWRGH